MRQLRKATALLLSGFLTVAALTTQGLADTTAFSPTERTSPAAAAAVEADTSLLKGLNVGFVGRGNSFPWYAAQTGSLQSAAARYGVELVCLDAQFDIAMQFTMIENLIASGVDYIVVNPIEPYALYPVLDACRAAGVPLILLETGGNFLENRYDAAIDPDFGCSVLIDSDYEKQGRIVGKWLVNKLDGSGKVVVLEGVAGSKAAIERQSGFDTAIAGTKVNVIARLPGDWSMSTGLTLMEDALVAFAADIDAVYAHSDDMALGAIEALRAAGLTPGKDVLVVSVDGSREALQAIVDGSLGCTAHTNPFYGRITFETIARLEAGENVPKNIHIKEGLFDSTNARKYVDIVP